MLQSLETMKCNATCSTRRLHHSGIRQETYCYPDWAIPKQFIQDIGWICSRHETTYFRTICSPENRFCDLQEVTVGPSRGMKHGKAIHKVKFQEHGMVRVAPFGLGRFHFMDAERDAKVEFLFPDRVLRLFYPRALKPFQLNSLMKNTVTEKLLKGE